LGSAATLGNAVIIWMAYQPDTAIYNITASSSWGGAFSASTGGIGVRCVCTSDTTLSSFALSGSAAIVSWFVAEVSGLASTGFDLSGSTPVGIDLGSIATGFNTFNTSFDIGPTATSETADEFMTLATISMITTGTPPAISSVTEITGGQPGTWARLGSTAATSRSAGNTNIRLDLYSKFIDTQGQVDATVVRAASCTVTHGTTAAFKSYTVPKQQTLSRQAKDSMH